jgi:hypothetical protein
VHDGSTRTCVALTVVRVVHVVSGKAPEVQGSNRCSHAVQGGREPHPQARARDLGQQAVTCRHPLHPFAFRCANLIQVTQHDHYATL